MIVNKVRNATTKDSATTYEVTLRVYPSDFESSEYTIILADLVKKAINGISEYEY